jgi:hypothetical protein
MEVNGQLHCVAKNTHRIGAKGKILTDSWKWLLLNEIIHR